MAVGCPTGLGIAKSIQTWVDPVMVKQSGNSTISIPLQKSAWTQRHLTVVQQQRSEILPNPCPDRQSTWTADSDGLPNCSFPTGICSFRSSARGSRSWHCNLPMAISFCRPAANIIPSQVLPARTVGLCSGTETSVHHNHCLSYLSAKLPSYPTLPDYALACCAQSRCVTLLVICEHSPDSETYDLDVTPRSIDQAFGTLRYPRQAGDKQAGATPHRLATRLQ